MVTTFVSLLWDLYQDDERWHRNQISYGMSCMSEGGRNYFGIIMFSALQEKCKHNV